MDFFASHWRVTLGGTLLLDFGDLLEAQPEIVPARKVEEVLLLGGIAANRFPRGNVSHTLSIRKVVRYDTHAAALVGKIATLQTAPTGKGDCVLAFSGTTSGGVIANAVLGASSPSVHVDGQLLKITYHIVGGAIAATIA